MNVNHLIYFCTLADTKNFSLAADKCFTTQPNLSYGIKALEEELGIQLIDRNNKNLELTEAGTIYLSYVTTALQELKTGERALSDYKNKINGEHPIKIGGRRLNYFTEILSKFQLQENYRKFSCYRQEGHFVLPYTYIFLNGQMP